MKNTMAGNEGFYQKLGSQIRAARKKALLTQEALAAKISLTRATVTNIEKGRQQLLVHTLIDIAEALNVPPASLLPEQQSLSIDRLLTLETIQAQEWIRRAVDLADRD
jgi:transcriptional regulator with XRE-family HTH domain